MLGKVNRNAAFLLLNLIYVVALYKQWGLLTLIFEDLALPFVFFALGYKFSPFLLLCVLIFGFEAFLFRYVAEVSMWEAFASFVYIVPYCIGGRLYRKYSIKWPVFVGVTFVSLIVLMIPYIYQSFYDYLIEAQRALYGMEREIAGVSAPIIFLESYRQKLINSYLYWGFMLEVVLKLGVSFIVLKYFVRWKSIPDYSVNLVYFHKKYGRLVTASFLLILGIYVLGIQTVLVYSLPAYFVYYLVTGILCYREWRALYGAIKKSVLPTVVMVVWLMFIFINEVTFIAAMLAVLIYSVYTSLNGYHIINKLIFETINKLKGEDQ